MHLDLVSDSHGRVKQLSRHAFVVDLLPTVRFVREHTAGIAMPRPWYSRKGARENFKILLLI